MRSFRLRTRLGIPVSAAVYITGAAGVEAVSGWRAEGHGSGSTGLLLLSTLEENLEMIGTTLFILVIVEHFARFERAVALRGEL